MPPLNGAGDIPVAIGALTEGVSSGELTPAEAAGLAKVVESYRLAVETVDIDRRLTALEERQARRE